MSEDKIYTHDIASDIIEVFEHVLESQDIILSSPEDDEKEPENKTPIYGSTYYEMQDTIEGIIIEMLKQAGIEEDKYVTDEYSGN